MTKKTGTQDPPIANRFQKGTSGNPKGRPRKQTAQKSSSAFEILLHKKLVVTRNGVPHEATMEEALQHRTFKDALAGNRAAVKEVLKWIAKRDAALAGQRKPTAGIELQIEPVDPTHVNAALLILGIADYDKVWNLGGDRLLLEPWAVQSALSRRKGGSRLRDDERLMIELCVGDPSTLPWSRGTSDD